MRTSHMIESLPQFPGWPSQGSVEILRISETLDDVKARLHGANLITQKGDEKDGLGPYESLVLKDPLIGVVALITHTHAPYPGTEIFVDAGTSIDTAIARVKDFLHLSKKDVVWVHPGAKPSFDVVAKKYNLSPRKFDVSSNVLRSVDTVPLSKVAAELAMKKGMKKKYANDALGDFVDLVVKHLVKGNKVRITGLGILQVKKSAARMGRNPATGEIIKIKASKKVAFRATKDLKDVI